MKNIILKPFIGKEDVNFKTFSERVIDINLEEFGVFRFELYGIPINYYLSKDGVDIDMDNAVLLNNKIFYNCDPLSLLDDIYIWMTYCEIGIVIRGFNTLIMRNPIQV